jgi:hypothetical protein
MKIIKIIFGVLTALLALAYMAKLIGKFSSRDKPIGLSHTLGTVLGMLIAATISIALFLSVFRE